MNTPTIRRRRLRPIWRLLTGIFFLCLVMFGHAGRTVAGESSALHWEALETRHTIVLYLSVDDLARFDRKIKFSDTGSGLGALFKSKRADGSLSDKVAGKVDALFERVQEILDMRRAIKKPSILIHPDRQALHASYRQLYNRPCKIRAWYQYSTNGIYLNVGDLHEGMLAHEMAHAIIDHYLLVRPPAATAEILARYVDSHLKD